MASIEVKNFAKDADEVSTLAYVQILHNISIYD